MNLENALWLDGVIVALGVLVLLARPGISFMHPGILYTLFHVYLFSSRGWAVLAGAETSMNVPIESFPKAILMADAALVAGLVGWLAAGTSRPDGSESRDMQAVVRPQTVHWVALVAIPAGLASLLTTGFVPGRGESTFDVTTGYQTVAVLWPALMGVALVYVHGFRLVILAPLTVYIGLLAVQGHSRFRFAIPLIMLLLVYLSRKGLRWPPVRLWVPLLLLVALFIPLKSIGMQVREGTVSWSSVVDTVKMSSGEATRGENSEQALLDQFVAAVVLADEKELVLMGRPYLALLTLPVPRPLWPSKPGLADHLQELQSSRYPLAERGAITTLPGDLYLNFRWVGVVLGSFLLALVSGALYRKARQASHGSAYMFLYILLASIVVQVARDGVISIVMFSLVNATPWVVIYLLSIRRRSVDRAVRARRTVPLGERET